MPIECLSAETASKLAAGEVVERPAAVVRELIDNAIDAGARSVHVLLSGGGLDLVKVTDDGSGIDRADLAICTERHSTSKLRSIEDLATISSLGFRGEALYSIAAVSRLRIRTRPPGAFGWEVEYEGTRVLRESASGCPDGTQIEARDLFYNTPARLKFLRGPTAEASRVEQLLRRYILGHPAVRFTLEVDGREVLRSPGSGELGDAIAAVWGWRIREAMLPVEGEEHGVAVSGYAGSPRVSRSNRSDMHVFVNHRWVQSRPLLYAAQEAYSSLLMVGRFPVMALEVRVPPEQLDVNVHPAKSEVRFADERAVTSAIGRSVRAALLSQAVAASEARAEIEISQFSFGGRAGDAARDQPVPAPTTTSHEQPRTETDEAPSRLPPLRILGQLARTYIIAEGPEGMCLIDQHAAHERVLLERLQDAVGSGRAESQALLEPLVVPLTGPQQERVTSFAQELARLGFEAEPFGERALLVRSVPGPLPADRAHALLEALGEGLEALDGAEERQRAMLATLACHGAIRAGQVLELAEMRTLIRQLEDTRVPTACAHGRPTLLELSRSDLEREFGRRGAR